MAKKKGTIQKKDLELLISKIKEVGFLEATTEYSVWDDFEGHELGDAMENFQQATQDLREKIEDACIDKGIEFSFMRVPLE